MITARLVPHDRRVGAVLLGHLAALVGEQRHVEAVLRRVKPSCESTLCDEMPTTVASSAPNASALSRYEQNCLVQTAVLSPG